MFNPDILHSVSVPGCAGAALFHLQLYFGELNLTITITSEFVYHPEQTFSESTDNFPQTPLSGFSALLLA